MARFHGVAVAAAVALFAAAMLAPDQAAAEADAAKAPGVEVRYEAGRGIRVATPDGNNALALGGRVQLLYTATDGDVGRDRSGFSVRRARVTAGGHVYRPQLRFYFQGDFANDFELRDALLEYTLVPQAAFRVGQFKIPFNRARVTSSGALQFVDRVATDAEFLPTDEGRDIGLQVGGTLLPERLSYALGAFNGTGPNTTSRDSNYLAVGRLLFTPLADFPDYYVESDLSGSPVPRLGLGAALAFKGNESAGRTTSRLGLADPDEFPEFRGADILGFTSDAHFKFSGLSALVDYYYRRVDPRGGAIAAFDAHGVNAQAGYFLLPQALEVALRAAWLDPSGNVPSNEIREYGVALSYFFRGHDLKLQADLRRVESDLPTGPTNDVLEGRVQVQAIF